VLTVGLSDMLADLFDDDDLALPAVYRRPGDLVGTPVRVVLDEGLQERLVGRALVTAPVTVAQVREAELPAVHAEATLELPVPDALGQPSFPGKRYRVQPNPERHADGCWRLGIEDPAA
jgi:hypothetical protein